MNEIANRVKYCGAWRLQTKKREIALEEKGLRIRRNKREYIEYDFGGSDQVVDGTKRLMIINDNIVSKVNGFKYYV